MKRQSIPRVAAKLLIPYILLYALYVQWHGDYGPGGGFQAGVIFAAGVILHAIVFDLRASQRALSPRIVQLLIPLGLLLYIGVGVVTMLKGGTFLNYSVLQHDPVHGQHLGILLVELGVGTTVAGVMISIFYAFGETVRS